jgi:hypothetical protein
MKKIFIVVAISILLLFPIVPAKETSADANQSRRTPWLMFDSVLEISYDKEVVNHSVFQPDGPVVTIPITIQYKVDIPQQILSNPLLRLFFLSTIIISSVQVSLTAENKPEWAIISFAPEKPYITISNTFQNSTAILQIALHSDAPANPYRLRIKSETPKIYTIDNAEAYCDLTFRPVYVPLLNGNCDPSPKTPPNQLTFIPISICNLGNDFTKVTAEVLNIDELNGWIVYVTPETYLPLDPSKDVNVTFLCIPPIYFEGNQTIDLRFTPSRWSNPEETGTPINVLITAHYP